MTDKPDARLLNFRPPESLLKAVAALRVNQPGSVWKVCADLSSKLSPVCAPLSSVLKEGVDPPRERMTDDGGSLVRKHAEAERARRIKLAEEEERARLRVRDEWEQRKRESEQPRAHQEEGPNRLKASKKKKRDFVAEVVERIHRFHAERARPFDIEAMPGAAGDLRWLMGRLYPDQFEGMEPKAFQEHYRGVCSWPREMLNKSSSSARGLISSAYQ